MREPIRIYGNRQPSIVFCFIIVPIILLSIYATIHSGVIANLGSTVVMTCMLVIILYYFNSQRLSLTDDSIAYRSMWRSGKILICDISIIEPGRGPFGAGHTWKIWRKGSAVPIILNITNFNSHDLQKIMKALVAANHGVDVFARK